MAEADGRPLLYIGLGNPGRDYELTRHNMGFLVMQAFAQQQGWHFKEESRFNSRIAKGVIEGQIVHLVLPLTFMNLSGVAVRRYCDYYHIPCHRLIVVTDDIALPFGQQRLRLTGSAGGHNGLKSVEMHLGTNQYPRLRLGIGHPGEKFLAEYVLEAFSQRELEELPEVISRGVSVLQRLLKETPAQVMNAANPSPPQEQQKKPEREINDLTKPPMIG